MGVKLASGEAFRGHLSQFLPTGNATSKYLSGNRKRKGEGRVLLLEMAPCWLGQSYLCGNSGFHSFMSPNTSAEEEFLTKIELSRPSAMDWAFILREVCLEHVQIRWFHGEKRDGGGDQGGSRRSFMMMQTFAFPSSMDQVD